jgi:hypothetical protein
MALLLLLHSLRVVVESVVARVRGLIALADLLDATEAVDLFEAALGITKLDGPREGGIALIAAL